MLSNPIKQPTMNYNEYSTEALIECMTENRPLYKDSGTWSIYEDEFEIPIVTQHPTETLREFILRYYDFISEYEEMKDVNINLAIYNL